jgi:hypothetical protein
MNTTIEKPTRNPHLQTPVNVLVERKFVGDKTINEAMIPIIFEDLLHKAKQIHTFENEPDSA